MIIKNIKKLYIKLIFIPLIILYLLLGLFSNISMAKENDIIIVGVTTDRCPMIYIDKDSGEIIGIAIELLKEAAKNSNLNIEFRSLSEANYKDALDNPEYDILMPLGSAITSTNGKQSIITNTIVDTPFTFVTLKSNNISDIENMKVGLLSSMRGVGDTIQELYPDMQITFYENMDIAIKALRKGEIEALLQNTYVWTYYLQKPSYSDLELHTTAIAAIGLQAGTVDTEEGRKIINTLNTGIDKISNFKKQAIILDYTSRSLYKYNFEDYVYAYCYQILFIILFVILTAFIAYEQIRRVKFKNKEKIKDILNKDSLTDALTFGGFLQKAEKIIKNNPDTKYMILYTNFKDFKYLNDKFGKKAGDDLLRFFVSTSKKHLDEDEAIGRLGRDHFVTLRKIKNEDVIADGKENIVEPVENFFADKNKEIQVKMYCGIYVLTDKDYIDVDINHMIDAARIAEQTIQERKKDGFIFYNPIQWDKSKRISEITAHLQTAIKEGEIKVYYQPQINFETRKVIGAEALCRWNYKNKGFISPGEFIPILEEAGLISMLDKFVWESVCKDLARWKMQNIYRKASINISRFDINDFDIAVYIHNLVKENGLDVEQLNIEITETACIESKAFIDTVKKFRSLGFKVEIDDFGSGYSSLNMLKDVETDRIKLDLRFLSGETESERGKIIIECMIFMAKKLGIELIAEGIETLEQANMLKSLGCTDMQGYYFYKPLPVEEFEKI